MQARGVSQTSLDRIARRAQVTRGAIYWHFSDKRALLEAMVARTHLPLRDLRQCLSQHIPGNEPLWLLREMMRHGLEPAPERKTTWNEFLKAHLHLLAATDFLTVEVWKPVGLLASLCR